MLENVLSLADISVQQAETFFLVLIRVSAMIFLMPFFKSEHLLKRMKIGISLLLSIILFPLVENVPYEHSESVAIFFVLVIKEVSIGLLMGFATLFLFLFVNIGAEIIDREMGLSQARMIDPATGEDKPAFITLMTVLFSVMLMASNGHFFFVEAISSSYKYIPINAVNYNTKALGEIFIPMVSFAFIAGMKFAAPVMTVTLVSSIGMGFMARIMPQMNIWIVAAPFKIAVGVVSIIYVLPLMYNLFDGMFTRLQETILILFKVSSHA